MSSYFRQQLESWLKALEVRGSVLDVGGSQKPIKGRTKTWDVSNYHILDIDEKADTKFDLNSLKKHEQLFPFEKKWDNIFCLEVFEYLVNPLNAVLNLADWLDEQGTLYLSLPFVYPLHNPEGTDMLRYTENWAKEVLGHYGFKDIDIKRRVALNGGLLTAFYNSDGMKAQPGIEHDTIGYLIKARKN